ncbi:hypothetical protein [Nakamurella lactea]|uniref:hypothetical protein n=1 Tax=Nakamurella lactea TaxID=459515 RepID=UPI0004902DCB|nr:hypothetical protein [Nakamurella lactea]
MRRISRFALSVLVAGLAMVISAIPASAGGPTTMVLSATDIGRATALSYSDGDFQDLGTLLGSGGAGTPAEPHGANGPYVTVTWLMYGGEIGRVDRVYYYAGADPWIWTQVRYSASQRDRQGLWHHSENGSLLAGMLDRLVINPEPWAAGGPTPQAPSGIGQNAGSAAGQASPGPAPVTATSRILDRPDFAGWPFAVVGLAVGAALAVLAGLGLGLQRRRSEGDDDDGLAPLPVVMLGDG